MHDDKWRDPNEGNEISRMNNQREKWKILIDDKKTVITKEIKNK